MATVPTQRSLEDEHNTAGDSSGKFKAVVNKTLPFVRKSNTAKGTRHYPGRTLLPNSLAMSNSQIKEQVRIIERVTNEAAKSKQKALQFLKDAGIVPSSPSGHSSKKK